MQHKVNFPKGELMIYHLVSYKPQPIEVIMKSEKLCVRTESAKIVSFNIAAHHMTTRELMEKLEIKHNRVGWYNYATDRTTDCLKSFVEHLMADDYFNHLNEDYLRVLADRLDYE